MFENAIEIFKNEKFGQVRTMIINEEPWFVGKDVAIALGYKNHRDAILKHVSIDDKGESQIATTSGIQKMAIINESGLYALIFSSKLESAQEFKHWVTAEVLPSIRKNGAYMTPDTIVACLQKPETLIQLLETLKSEQEKNIELQKTNAALTEQAQEWENKPVLNALMRSYAVKMYNSAFGVAWNELYKNVKYAEHIDLKLRRGHDKSKTKKSLIDYAKDDEYKKIVKQAVAMCEKAGIDVNKVIGAVNTQKVNALVACG